jgi:hypothetical protein
MMKSVRSAPGPAKLPDDEWIWDVGAVVFFVVLDVLLFWPVFFAGQFVPRGGGDLVSFIYPRYSFVAHFVRQGVLPLWDPYLYSGQPYLADVQSGLLYLPNLLVFALVRNFDYHKLELLAIGHYALAGIFAYVLGRRLRLSRFGALTAGIVWECSGFLIAHLGHYNLVAVAVWTPLILALLQPALEGGSIAWVAAAALALATSTLAGHTQLSLYTGLLILIYVVGFTLATRSWARSAAIIGGLAIWSVILCVVQLWPSYQLTQDSVRADLSYDDATAFAMLPQKLILFIVPHFYGRSPDAYWGPPSLTENYLYVGIVPLALAALALVLVRDWRARAFAAIALVGLLLAFADWTPLHGWLYALAPGFDKVRAPGRFLFFVDFGLAMLAGLGADALGRPLLARRRPALRLFTSAWAVATFGLLFVVGPLVYIRLFVNRSQAQAAVDQLSTATSSFALTSLFVLITLALLVAYRYRWLRGNGLAAVVVGLIIVDLVGNNGVINPTSNDPTVGFEHPAVQDFLNQNLKGGRLDTVTGVEDVWQPDAAALYGYRSLWGLFDPLTITDYYWFWKIHVPGRSSRLYDLLGATYLLGHKDVTLDTTKFKRVFTADPQIDVFQDTTAMPRAFFVSGVTNVPNHDAALAAIKDPAFDPSRSVVLEGVAPANGSSGSAEPATITSDGPNSVVVHVDAPSNGYLVLADPYYPGWQGIVDGQGATVLRADWVFRAIAVGPGPHDVTFRFRPTSLVVGGIISGLGWLAAIGVVGFGIIRSKRRRTEKIPVLARRVN